MLYWLNVLLQVSVHGKNSSNTISAFPLNTSAVVLTDLLKQSGSPLTERSLHWAASVYVSTVLCCTCRMQSVMIMLV